MWSASLVIFAALVVIFRVSETYSTVHLISLDIADIVTVTYLIKSVFTILL
jgi:hypothetical protein